MSFTPKHEAAEGLSLRELEMPCSCCNMLYSGGFCTIFRATGALKSFSQQENLLATGSVGTWPTGVVSALCPSSISLTYCEESWTFISTASGIGSDVQRELEHLKFSSSTDSDDVAPSPAMISTQSGKVRLRIYQRVPALSGVVDEYNLLTLLGV